MDVGTGDGLFIYNCARQNADKFFIGIDANHRPLQKISEKIYRKPAKGGLSNVLFVLSAVETLPSELDGVANEIHVNFPWGSLLRAVAGGDEIGLRNLRQMCATDALLTVVIGLDVERDHSELDRLALPALDVDYLSLELPGKYLGAGFEMVKSETLTGTRLLELKTTWARRSKAGHHRSFIRIVARAVELRRATLWAL